MVRLARMIPTSPAEKHVAQQCVRAATSAGANYEEARAAQSKADFIHKIALAAKELRETHFWLRLIVEAEMVGHTTRHDELERIIGECRELNAILAASIRTARKG